MKNDYFTPALLIAVLFNLLSLPSATQDITGNSEILPVISDSVTPLNDNAKAIHFTFDNVEYDTEAQYVEFDIMAKTDGAGLKLGKAEFFIKYTKEFGQNIVENKAIMLSQAQVISEPYYKLDQKDLSENRLWLSVQPISDMDVPHTFSGSMETLIRVKLKIKDFTQIGSISFDDIDITGKIYYQDEGSLQLFDQVVLDQPLFI